MNTGLDSSLSGVSSSLFICFSRKSQSLLKMARSSCVLGGRGFVVVFFFVDKLFNGRIDRLPF
jgi:hypothetical protein